MTRVKTRQLSALIPRHRLVSMSVFGVKLAEARKAAGMAQSDLAPLLDMDRTNLSRLENGRSGRPGDDLLHRIADVKQLNLTMDILLSWRLRDEYPIEAIEILFDVIKEKRKGT